MGAEVAQSVEQWTENLGNYLPSGGGKMARAMIREDQIDLDVQQLRQINGAIDPETAREILKGALELHKVRARKPKIVGPPGTITIRKAAKKHGLSSSTVWRWMERGWIPVIAVVGNKKFLDEQLLNEVVEFYKRDAGQGKHTLDIRQFTRMEHSANSP